LPSSYGIFLWTTRALPFPFLEASAKNIPLSNSNAEVDLAKSKVEVEKYEVSVYW